MCAKQKGKFKSTKNISHTAKTTDKSQTAAAAVGAEAVAVGTVLEAVNVSECEETTP